MSGPSHAIVKLKHTKNVFETFGMAMSSSDSSVVDLLNSFSPTLHLFIVCLLIDHYQHIRSSKQNSYNGNISFLYSTPHLKVLPPGDYFITRPLKILEMTELFRLYSEKKGLERHTPMVVQGLVEMLLGYGLMTTARTARKQNNLQEKVLLCFYFKSHF
jgi:hypothetical protein